MEFKELKALTLTARRSQYCGHWKSQEQHYSEITIYMSSSIERKKTKRKERPGPPILCVLPDYYISETFLIEYLCSCIFRGNHFKKKCWNKKKDVEKICIPEIVSNSILKLLDD
jgi:hypothetical protein